MGKRIQALVMVPLFVGVLTCAFALLGRYVAGILGIPVRLHIPLVIRIGGGAVLVFGCVFLGWLFRYRSPVDIFMSTYVTIRKVIRRTSEHEVPPRTEPLVLLGPQRHVRHPLYFAVVVLLFGGWLLLGHTLLLFMALFFFLWFTLVVIRFEEKELRELFGEEYEAYARAVPMIFPSLKPKWH